MFELGVKLPSNEFCFLCSHTVPFLRLLVSESTDLRSQPCKVNVFIDNIGNSVYISIDYFWPYVYKYIDFLPCQHSGVPPRFGAIRAEIGLAVRESRTAGTHFQRKNSDCRLSRRIQKLRYECEVSSDSHRRDPTK